jgi:hypothetical protein
MAIFPGAYEFLFLSLKQDILSLRFGLHVFRRAMKNPQLEKLFWVEVSL